MDGSPNSITIDAADTASDFSWKRKENPISIDRNRDDLLTDFGKETLKDRYLIGDESYQDLFARVSYAYADDNAHAQRIYDYMSKLWFMPATPVLSNGGTTRGLPISCYLSAIGDSLKEIKNNWTECIDLASKGGGIGCVDSETECLTPKGWVKMSEYQENTPIVSVSSDGSHGWFDLPEKYVKFPVSKMYKFSNDYSEMVVSDNHRNLVKFDNYTRPLVKTTTELLEGDRFKKARFIGATKITGGEGLPYTDLELRFLVALAADGSNFKDDVGIRFALKRYRKIIRLREILNSLGMIYDEIYEDAATKFYVFGQGIKKVPLTFEYFGAANGHQLSVIFAELGYWDGSFDLRNDHLRMSTAKPEEADFIQYVIMSATGRKAGLGTKFRDSEIVVRETDRINVMFSKVEEYVPDDGMQYCFQTKTSFWLARRNGMIFVTGNTYYGNIRSIGEKVGLNGKTSGIMPFIKVMDSLTLGISQGSLRRGSAAVYIDIHHPEIEEFIEIRKPSGDFNRKALNLHHGVLITDKFMEAVKQGKDFDLISPRSQKAVKTVNARALYQKIVETRMATGEPYMVFIDTVNNTMAEHQKKLGLKITTSNLCVAPETKILTKQGYKPISTLENQDVDVWNGEEWSNVKIVKTGTDQKLIKIKFSNHNDTKTKTIEVTPYHKFYIDVNGEEVEVRAHALSYGDRIYDFDVPGPSNVDEWYVTSIVDEGRHDDTYCAEEPKRHRLVFNGILTGNCSEITLPTGIDHLGNDRTAVCCLSSLNVETWDQWHDHPTFIEDVMRFLDNVLQSYIDHAPEEMVRAKYSAMRERSVGLGIMGLHSLFQQKNIPFESAMAKSWNMRIFKHVKAQADKASVVLAEERGACPDAQDAGVMERFSHKIAIAPTASISIITGGTSAGIEPIPANIYNHKTLSGSYVVKNPYLEKIFIAKGKNTESTWSSILEHEGSVQHLDFLDQHEKDVYKTAFELDQRWIVDLAADRTPYICQAQSLNLFLPGNVNKWDLLMLHYKAWELGVKSLYYCRSKSIQRASFAGGVEADNTIDKRKIVMEIKNYDECLACQ